MKTTALLATLLLGTTATAADAPTLRAGAYAIDVTPESFPVSVNGGFTDRQATKASDPLHARCLVLDDGKTKLAIVVVDSCMIPREIIDAARTVAAAKTGIPAANILVSATHTHTAPTVTGVFQSKPDEGYVKLLTAKIAEGIEKAHANLAPAELGYGVAQEPSQLFNRRWKMKPGTIAPDPFGNTTDLVKMNPGHQNPGLLEPAGPTDPDVSVLSIRSTTGRPLALLANYSLHYVGDLPPLSADYFGAFADRIGGLVGADDQAPAFVGILSNGTSGDVNNVNFRNPPLKTDKPGDRCRNVAEVVAKAAKRANDSATFRRDATLAVANEELELRVRKPTAKEVEDAEIRYQLMEKPSLQPRKPFTVQDLTYLRETLLLSKYPDTVKLRLQAMRIGGLGIVAIPCEVFTEIGLAVKAKSPLKPTFTIELANGYNGYLPTPAQHRLGGYETWRARSSYLEVEASDKITAVVLRLLDKVK